MRPAQNRPFFLIFEPEEALGWRGKRASRWRQRAAGASSCGQPGPGESHVLGDLRFLRPGPQFGHLCWLSSLWLEWGKFPATPGRITTIHCTQVHLRLHKHLPLQIGWDWHGHTAIFKIGDQQGPAVEHGELCSIFCNKLNGKGIWKRRDTCLGITESLCCSPETNTTLLINYTPI